MAHKSKRSREIAKLFDASSTYTIDEAIDILKKCPPVKFDQSVEVALLVGVDTSKSDQLVRGTVSLPNGTGKKLVVLVFAKGDKLKEAQDAGADFAGAQEYLDKVQEGWTDFDAVIATPDMMRDVGKLGKILGPRGLMPTPKAGTVTADVGKAVKEVKGGRVEFRVDKHGAVHGMIGKLSFSKEKLHENAVALLNAVARAKPAAAKGEFLKSLALASTMGPGIKVALSGMVEAS